MCLNTGNMHDIKSGSVQLMTVITLQERTIVSVWLLPLTPYIQGASLELEEYKDELNLKLINYKFNSTQLDSTE